MPVVVPKSSPVVAGGRDERPDSELDPVATMPELVSSTAVPDEGPHATTPSAIIEDQKPRVMFMFVVDPIPRPLVCPHRREI